jgi:cytoskeleton protein RodZ
MTQPAENIAVAQPQGAGPMLAGLRRQKGITIETVCARLRFAHRQVEALEAGRYDALPDLAFTRAMIRSYARFLEADDQPLLKALEAERPDAAPPSIRTHRPVVAPSQGITFSRDEQAGNRRLLTLAALLLALTLVAAWAWHFGFREQLAADKAQASFSPASGQTTSPETVPPSLASGQTTSPETASPLAAAPAQPVNAPQPLAAPAPLLTVEPPAKP